MISLFFLVASTVCVYVGGFICFNCIFLYTDDKSGLTIFLCSLCFILKNLPVNFVSIIDTSGIVKQAAGILFFILLTLAHSRDGIILSSFEMECMSLTFILINFTTFEPMVYYPLALVVFCVWKIESSQIAVSFSDDITENAASMCTVKFTFHYHFPSSMISLCFMLYYIFFRKKAIALCNTVISM